MGSGEGDVDGVDDVMYRSLVEGAGDLIAAFDDDGTIAFVNAASATVLGREKSEIVGHNVFDFIHPDDLERALRSLALNIQFGSAPGTTSFRLRHADGSWVPVDMTGGEATDGTHSLYSSISRVADDRYAISETMLQLLAGKDLPDVLRPVCDLFAWRANGSQIGICWRDDDGGRGATSTGVPRTLIGADDARDTPWCEVRATGRPSTDLDLHRLDDEQRAQAEAAGLGAFWIEPVDCGRDEATLITVWTKKGSRPPVNHAYAMETVRSVVEVILRWQEQQHQLDHAAFHDALTGLANRKSFFRGLDECQIGGAFLFCDLDRFKPVNDRFGHAVGDELLRLVAGRIEGCVRRHDLVARIGGDEFAVLCPGASEEVAEGLAERIRRAVEQPYEINGEIVEIGMSIGTAHDAAALSAELLEAADRALYDDKAGKPGRP